MFQVIVLLLIILFLWSFAYILSQKDIMAPSVMMCNMFIISSTFALINIENWDYVNYRWETVFIITTGIFVYICVDIFLGIILQNGFNIHKVNYKIADLHDNTIQVQNWKLVAVLLVAIITIIWYFLEIRRIVGSSGLNTANLFASYRVYTTYLANFSDSEIKMTGFFLNQLVRLTYMSGYVAVFVLVKNIFSKQKALQKQDKTNKFLLICIFLLSFIPGFMNAERNQFLQLLIATFVYYYITWHQENGWYRSLSWKFIRMGMIGVVVGIPLFYLLLNLLGRSTELTAFESGSVYLGSSIPLFNQYIVDPVDPPRVFGEETLLGVHQLLENLGVETYVKNRHLEFRSLNDHTVSNIYTFFRRPFHDFGLVGMYIFVAVVAVFFAWFYFGKIKNRSATRKRNYWAVAYGYFYYWIFYSSIDQRSISFIATTPIVNIIALLVIYWFFTYNKIRFVVKRKVP